MKAEAAIDERSASDDARKLAGALLVAAMRAGLCSWSLLPQLADEALAAAKRIYPQGSDRP